MQTHKRAGTHQIHREASGVVPTNHAIRAETPSKEVRMKDQKTGKKHLLLNHPFWLVAFLRAPISFQERYTESLCKRISWIVAQTIAKQLVSVVNTSI
jgi:hypothetical protein